MASGEGAMTARYAIDIDRERLAEYCRRWKIVELSLFGSVLRDDFGPGSDVDILVTFAPDAEWSVLDHVSMEEEVSALLGRKVDVVNRRAVENSANPLRRRAILDSAQPYYVAR
jgi:predicted nucleotidyltransferase